MRKQAIEAICHQFNEWVNAHEQLKPVCQTRCSACCTQNVTITAMEGETILDYIVENNLSKWFAAVLGDTLASRCGIAAPNLTTNEFAEKCFAGEAPEQNEQPATTTCPFLQDNLCKIYSVRPFGCRLFFSQTRCSSDTPATIPDFHLDAATACCQMIEHLGQKEYWGNMVDVLAALLDIGIYQEIGQQIEHAAPGLLVQAKMRVRAASPLPGFLIEETCLQQVKPLLDTIFTHTISEKTVHDILNGH